MSELSEALEGSEDELLWPSEKVIHDAARRWLALMPDEEGNHDPDLMADLAYQIAQHVRADDEAVRANPMLFHDAVNAVLGAITGNTE